MKVTAILKPSRIEEEMMCLLRQILERTGFIEGIQLKNCNLDTLTRFDAHPDFQIEFKISGQPHLIYVEGKSSGQPKFARLAILQLQAYASKFPANKRPYGVFMAPYISEQSAHLCTEAGIGYADLAGNVLLKFDHVFIEKRSAENPFKESREDRPLFSSRSERVLRLMLTPPLRPWKVQELSRESGVSLGQVSAVRRQLLEREWAEVGEDGIKLTRPEDLARSWQKVYKPRHIRETGAYTLKHGKILDEAVAKALSEAGDGTEAVLASYSAARWIAPYARQSTLYLYATERGSEILHRHLQLESAAKGENVVIWTPREDDVFTRRIEPAPGMWCTSLIQTWLDLGVSGDRGQEAADHLQTQELVSKWRALI